VTEPLVVPPLPEGAGDRVDDHALGVRLHRRASAFDDAVDQAFDKVRGHRVVDRVFYEASSLGDFSLLWHLIGATQALRAGDPLADLIRTSSILGIESIAVNQGVKRLFQRERPIHLPDRPHRLRTPLTSSFPSGHATAAFTAAVVLSDGRRGRPVYFVVAAIVASSRVHVRIHHASDVVAGAAVGYAIGRVARRVWPRTAGVQK
jgi:undecaprenyl-diphosphatase